MNGAFMGQKDLLKAKNVRREREKQDQEIKLIKTSQKIQQKGKKDRKQEKKKIKLGDESKRSNKTGGV